MEAHVEAATVENATSIKRGGLTWYGFGIANALFVLIAGTLSWWLLTDPKWSPIHTYPNEFNAVMFWAILIVVFLAFNLELVGFAKLGQPLRGIVLTAVTVAGAIAVVALITRGWGAIDPSYSVDRPGGAGYLMAALPVLIGFFTYVTVSINWAHWPWPMRGLTQPWVGLGDIALMTPLTILGFSLLVVPGLAVWANPAHALMSIPTAIGWFYSVIVISILTGSLWENWPWRVAAKPGRVAAVSFVGNFALGTALYFAFLGLLHLLMNSADIHSLGAGLNSFPAEIGVCWNFWMILWANTFDNWPRHGSLAFQLTTRAVITFALGLATFVAYYYFYAQHVLHEPVAVGKLSGNALGFIDWLVLWTLVYVVYFGSIGLRRREEAAA